MTKEIKTFNTLSEAKAEKKKRAGIWRPLHTDIMDGKWKITFVNGIDDPDNSIESVTKRNNEKIKNEKIIVLKSKIDDDTSTLSEIREYLKLKASL